MVFPVSGPFDQGRGYTRIPTFRDSLEARGYRITEQARQSPALARLIRSGIAPPFREPSVAGLVIRDANKNPLELWGSGELARNPQMSWHELLVRSPRARASEWLFKRRNRKAQDLRLRIRIERDAFARMTPYWRKLGFPFDELVPSYATAIGSSADRPLALAELMGIIVNDGLRRPTTDIRRLSFGMGTPNYTVFEQTPRAGERVMRTPIARVLRAVLAEVVERGTARRVNHAFADNNGAPIRIGGKTGTGDNRIETFARGGRLLSSHVASRTAGFVFYVGDRWFGVITASVSARQAQDYTFTSSLPLAVLKLLAPTLDSTIRRDCQCQLQN